jgi:hypothetical protein
MRAHYFIVAAGTIGLLGCQETNRPNPTSSQPTPVVSQAKAPNAAELTAGLAGTWRFSMENSDSTPGEWATVELLPDGHFRWLPTGKDYVIPPEKGSWFVYEKVLVLRLRGNAGGHMPPGSALTFDIKTLTPQMATMSTPIDAGPGEVKQVMCNLKRLAQPDGSANASQPIRSETNSTSSAAGSRR